MGLTSEQAAERGLTMMWVYHCLRCNYSWLPRDFDPAYDDIETMEPPKACARCKSKSWNLFPQRNHISHQARVRALLRSKKLKEQRLLPLTQWARKIFAQGRKEGHDDTEIAEWVKAYAHEGNWSQDQIYQVLEDNGVVVSENLE